jgi:hypothetical protein
VRVRLTPKEHAAWSAARAVTGSRELGAWVRVTVNELLSLPSGERLDRPAPVPVPAPEPVPQIVDAQTYLTLVTAANALGELVARANTEQRHPAEQEAGAVTVKDARELVAAEYLRPVPAQSDYLDAATSPVPWPVRAAPRHARGGRPMLGAERRLTGSKRPAALTRTAARPLETRSFDSEK